MQNIEWFCWKHIIKNFHTFIYNNKIFLNKIISFFNFTYKSKICVRIIRLLIRDIANLRFRDNVQNFKTRFVFEKYGPAQKTGIKKTFLFCKSIEIICSNCPNVYRDIKCCKKSGYVHVYLISIHSKIMKNT